MAGEKPKRTRKQAEQATPEEIPAAAETVDEQPAQAEATPTADEAATPEPDTQPEPEATEEPVEPEAAAEPEPVADAEPEPVADAEPEPVAGAESEPEAAAEEPAAEAEGVAELVEAAEEAPAAEPEPTAEPEPEPAAPAKRTRSQKHLPRSERRQRPKPVREQPKQRKPIVRLEKPASEPGRRQERRGVVVSDAMDKTIVVQVEVMKIHPRYKKVIRRSRKFHAHDERNEAKVGDVVRIVETRPLSKTKTWRLAEVVEAAK